MSNRTRNVEQITAAGSYSLGEGGDRYVVGEGDAVQRIITIEDADTAGASTGKDTDDWLTLQQIDDLTDILFRRVENADNPDADDLLLVFAGGTVVRIVGQFGEDQANRIEYLRLSDKSMINLSGAEAEATGKTDMVFGDLVAGDQVSGGKGHDVLWGFGGNDQLSGGRGADTLHGGEGDDTLQGDHHGDRLNGAAGDDTLDGGTGQDRLFGGLGDDTLIGGKHGDMMQGGEGSDTYVINAGEARRKDGVGDEIQEHRVLGEGLDEETDVLHLTGVDSLDELEFRLIATEEDTHDLEIRFGRDHRESVLIHDQYGNNSRYDGIEILRLGDGSEHQIDVGNVVIQAANEVYTYADMWLNWARPAFILFDTAETAWGYGGVAIPYEFVWTDMVIYGTDGHDVWLSGNDGDDLMFGLDGEDRLYGEWGDDTIYGGAGRDAIDGNRHDDLLYGGAGDDRLNGGDDDDRLYGGDGNDVLEGSYHDDRLYGETGDDLLRGEHGNDRLYGGHDDDELEGGDGTDLLVGGRGDDQLKGGADNDRLNGGSGDDVLSGGNGKDSLKGSGGADELGGGAGEDSLSGGGGDDQLNGGDSQDRLMGGAGDDVLDGGAGKDRLIGNQGDDTLTGGADGDRFIYSAGDGADHITDFSQLDKDKLSIERSIADSMDQLTIDYDGEGQVTIAAPGEADPFWTIDIADDGAETALLVERDFIFF